LAEHLEIFLKQYGFAIIRPKDMPKEFKDMLLRDRQLPFMPIFETQADVETINNIETGRSMTIVEDEPMFADWLKMTFGEVLVSKDYAYLKSTRDGKQQVLHRDVALKQLEPSSPYLIGFHAVMDNTKIRVRAMPFGGKCMMERDVIISVPKDCMLMFHPLVVHSGCKYYETHYRLHFILSEDKNFDKKKVEEETHFVVDKGAARNEWRWHHASTVYVVE
jgi:hypothetical protein